MGRKLNLKHIYSVADDELRNTMTVNGSQFCVYGKCYYCKPTEKVCGDLMNQEIEGVLLHLIPGTFVRRQSPWQRTYKESKRAEWEENSEYCRYYYKNLKKYEKFKIVLNLQRLEGYISRNSFARFSRCSYF